jgi:hypothetical protein
VLLSHVFSEHHRQTLIWILADCNADFASSSPISQGCATSALSLTAESGKVWRWIRLQYQRVQINFSKQIGQEVKISVVDTETRKLKHTHTRAHTHTHTRAHTHTHTHTHTQNGGHITFQFFPVWRKKKLSIAGLERPWKRQEVEAPRNYRKSAYDGGDVSPTHPPPLPPDHNPRTHFCQRLSQPQGHSAAGRIRSMKNYNNPVGGTTCDLPTCSAVPQPTAPPLWRNERRLKCTNFTKVYKKFHTRYAVSYRR